MTPQEKIRKARAGLVLDLPFFGSLALRLRVIEDPTCPTAWTDGETLAYNPSYIESLPLEQVKGIICHEVLHCACAHHARRGSRDRWKWNVAGDYVVNQILEDAKIPLPPGRLLDPAYKGMYAEKVYEKIPSPPDGGSSSDPDPGGCGEVRDARGQDGKQPTAADLARAEQDWKVAVGQAAQAAKMMGRLPGGIERLVEKILEPKVDWREVLRRFIDQSALNDYRWFPPNRRYISQGLYLPSLKSEELPPLIVAVDTSGSIGQDELDQFGSEISSILQEYQTTCIVLYCDAEVAGVEEFTSQDLPLRLHPKGGGGTDFRPPFRWVEEKGLRPSCLVYLTDMECSRFPDAPEYPVLWVHIGDGGEKPPFGEEVRI